MTIAGAYNFKWGIQLSGAFHYGSGQNFATTSSQNPFSLSGVADRLFTNTTAYYGNQSNLLPSGIPGYDLVRRDSLVGNPIERVDVRLSKTFTFKERFKLIPMVEAFNLFNHSNFGAYNNIVNTATFGTPASDVDLPYAPRMLQFAGRFEF